MDMAPDEIVVRYRQAKHKGEQLNILADLNACSVNDIVNVLVEHGGYKLEHMNRSRGKARLLKDEPDPDDYSRNLDNFTAPQELTVTITLNEYRKLVSANATASSDIEKANKDKYTREMENKNLKEEVAALKAKIYEMQNALDSFKTVPIDNLAERGEF